MKLGVAIEIVKKMNCRSFSSKVRVLDLGDDVSLFISKRHTAKSVLKLIMEFAQENKLHLQSEKDYYLLSDNTNQEQINAKRTVYCFS